jgi:glycosyltransferase involved in cell wall biosynthesis
LISHGVNTHHKHIENLKLPGKNNFKALYMGNLDMPFIDWELLDRATQKFRSADFFFLGSSKKSDESGTIKNLLNRDNVFHIPPVESEYIMSYLKAADLLLLAYQHTYYEQYASPHKMLEYLWSGTSILATYMPDYLNLKEYLYIATSNNDWLDKFELNFLNKDEQHDIKQREFRQNYAKEYTYEHQLIRIEKAIQQIWKNNR